MLLLGERGEASFSLQRVEQEAVVRRVVERSTKAGERRKSLTKPILRLGYTAPE